MRRCRLCALVQLTLTGESGGRICGGAAGYRVLPQWLLDGRCPAFVSGGLTPEAATDAGLTDAAV